jgi:hypothetical protein
MSNRRRRQGPARLGALLTVSALCGAAAIVPIAAARTATVRTAVARTATARAPSAHTARTIFLKETGRLHLTSRHNFTLNEQGSASGTIAGTIYVHLTAVSSSRVTAEVNIYVSGGSISGRGTASYRREATRAAFSGSISFGHGTGSYARAHGSGLSFSGTIAESHGDAIVVHVSGRMSD